MAFRRGYLRDLVRSWMAPEVAWTHWLPRRIREGCRRAYRSGQSFSFRDHYQIFKVAQPVASARMNTYFGRTAAATGYKTMIFTLRVIMHTVI